MKLGHLHFQIRPLGPESGQYPEPQGSNRAGRNSPVLKLGGLKSPRHGYGQPDVRIDQAQTGEMQLAVAARLSRMSNPDSGSSIAQLVGAADQSANSLTNALEMGQISTSLRDGGGAILRWLLSARRFDWRAR